MQIYVEIHFVCHDCKSLFCGEEEYKFRSLTEAYEHLLKNPDHHITAEGEA